MRIKSNGFTLVEISLVIVILSLVIGGISIGLTMFENTKMRKVMSEFERFSTAATTFQARYNCLPGDCANAYQHFGATCGTNTALEDGGCNGNGDSYITHPDFETFKAWHHLTYAKLVVGLDGAYDTAATPVSVNGSNCPQSEWSKQATWHWTYGGAVGTDWGTSEHILAFTGTTIDTDLVPVLSGPEALRMDTKFDDGLPRLGNVRSVDIGCFSGSAYVTTGSDPVCSLAFGQAY